MARPNFRDQDVLGLAEDEGQALITVLLVRAGLVTGGREYFFPELPPGRRSAGGLPQAVLHRGPAAARRDAAAREVPDRRLLEALFTDEKGAKVAPAGDPGRRPGPAARPGRGQCPGRPQAPPALPRTPGRPSWTCKPA